MAQITAVTFTFGLSNTNRSHGADHGGGSGHVVFPLPHAVGRLNRNAAGIEGDAFADQAEVNIFGRAYGVMAQDDQIERLVGALGDSPEGAHLELPNIVERRQASQFKPTSEAIFLARSARIVGVM